MPDGKRSSRPRGSGSERAADRGMGGLTGSGPSIVGVQGAMRARDVSPVSEDMLAEASRRVVLRRRAPDPPRTPPVPRPPLPAGPTPEPPDGA